MSTDWLSSRLADQADMFQNVKAKIGGYQATLGLTAAQVTAAIKLCDEFEAAYTFGEQYRSSSLAVIQWRDIILKGTPQGTPAPEPPTPPTLAMPDDSTIGIIQQFRDLRDIILASPGYTDAIGEDLMIVRRGGGSGPKAHADDATPELKLQVGSGYEVNIAGPMHGMDAMRIEWQPNGGSSWSLVGFLTKTPGHVIISPATPGQPESGRIRARYIHTNDPVGNYSPEYAVTVSA